MPSFDGTRIAWRADGPKPSAEGSTSIVLCNGIACDDGYWREVIGPLSEQRTVVRWDYRGHGRSEPPRDPEAVTIDAVIGDLAAVIDAAATDHVVLVGHSFGVQISLQAACALPARVRGVVAVAGAPGTPLGSLLGRNLGSLVFPPLELLRKAAPEASRALWRRWWTSGSVYWAARAIRGTSPAAPRDVLQDYFRHVGDLDLDVLLGMFRSMQFHTVDPEVVTVPLIAVAGDMDGMTPLAVMTDLAVRTRGELVVVRGGTHTLPAEHPEVVVDAVRRLADRLDRLAG